MAKYKEVHDKQRALEDMAERDEKMNKNLFVGFTFRYVNILLRNIMLTNPDTASPTSTMRASLRVLARRSPPTALSGLCSRPDQTQHIGARHLGIERRRVALQTNVLLAIWTKTRASNEAKQSTSASVCLESGWVMLSHVLVHCRGNRRCTPIGSFC